MQIDIIILYMGLKDISNNYNQNFTSTYTYYNLCYSNIINLDGSFAYDTYDEFLESTDIYLHCYFYYDMAWYYMGYQRKYGL